MTYYIIERRSGNTITLDANCFLSSSGIELTEQPIDKNNI